MALLDRRPEPNSRGYELAQGKNELCVFWFIPDCPSFGFWNSKPEAEQAKEIWLKNYRNAKQKDWQKYCQSRGYKWVSFR